MYLAGQSSVVTHLPDHYEQQSAGANGSISLHTGPIKGQWL